MSQRKTSLPPSHLTTVLEPTTASSIVSTPSSTVKSPTRAITQANQLMLWQQQRLEVTRILISRCLALISELPSTLLLSQSPPELLDLTGLRVLYLSDL